MDAFGSVPAVAVVLLEPEPPTTVETVERTRAALVSSSGLPREEPIERARAASNERAHESSDVLWHDAGVVVDDPVSIFWIGQL